MRGSLGGASLSSALYPGLAELGKHAQPEALGLEDDDLHVGEPSAGCARPLSDMASA